MGQFVDLTGMRFGRWTVISRAEKDKNKNVKWNCVCDCGNERVVLGSTLINGASKSCGCYASESSKARKAHFIHGMVNKRIYNIWNSMKQRCQNPNSNNYNRYGAKGVTVCEEWSESFIAFNEWSMKNGYREDLTIDRIDNNKGYYPDNCRWTDVETQSNNRRSNVVIEYNGKKQTLKEWSDELGVPYKLLHGRIRLRKWSFEKAINTPNLHSNYKMKRTAS